INQMDINMQVVAELSRSGGRGRLERLGGQHCGICGKGGYNARTYQVALKSSREEFSK
ncbi:hypothetical protein FOC1_g10000371, partial [Fusarium oxysporum f. sp. cubense race 1]